MTDLPWFGVLASPVAWLGVALLLDHWLGDPVYPWHPVRLMGRVIAGFEPWLLPWGRAGGALLLVGGGLICWGLGWFVSQLDGLWWAVQVALLYSLLGYGDLVFHVRQVKGALEGGDLELARAQVGRLVGRDTARMDEAAVCRAALESLSENFSDSFLAPLFWFLVAGLPGLLVFKWVSTLDSMIGYKRPPYLRYGSWPAWADDGLNWLPARLSWLVISFAALLRGLPCWEALKRGYVEQSKLASPNSGWPEAALAGALQVRLGGPVTRQGVLEPTDWLGPEHYAPARQSHLDQALKLFEVAWGLSVLLGLSWLGLSPLFFRF